MARTHPDRLQDGLSLLDANCWDLVWLRIATSGSFSVFSKETVLDVECGDFVALANITLATTSAVANHTAFA